MPTNNSWNSQDPVQIEKGGTGRISLSSNQVLVGSGTNIINGIVTIEDSGKPLVSQGVLADPAYGVASVPGGGTGVTSFDPYTVICGGATATSNLLNVVGTGDSGQLLTSNGPGTFPSWEDAPAQQRYALVVSKNVDTNVGVNITVEIPFEVVHLDEASCWDPINYKYYVPVKGLYFIQINVQCRTTQFYTPPRPGIGLTFTPNESYDANPTMSYSKDGIIPENNSGNYSGYLTNIKELNIGSRIYASLFLSPPGTRTTSMDIVGLQDGIISTWMCVYLLKAT